MSDLQKTLQYKSTSTYKIKGEQNEKAKPLAEKQINLDQDGNPRKDSRRTFTRTVKDETWDNAEKVRGFDPYFVRKDFAGNVVVRFVTRDVPIRKYVAPEYEHIVSHVNNGKTVLENCAVIQAVFNASKGHEELFNIHPKECNDIIKKSGGIKGSEFRREISENNFEHKKLNIRFEQTEKGLAPKVIAKTSTERPVYEPVYADKEDFIYKKYLGPDAKGKIAKGRENLEEFYNSVKSSKEQVLESDEETVRDSVRESSEEPIQDPVPETDRDSFRKSYHASHASRKFEKDSKNSTKDSPEPSTKESSKEYTQESSRKSTESRKDRSKESTREYSYEPAEESTQGSGDSEGNSTLEKLGAVITSLPAIKIVAGVIIVGGIVYGSYKLYEYYQEKEREKKNQEKEREKKNLEKELEEAIEAHAKKAEKQKKKERRREKKEFLEFLDEIQHGGISNHSDSYVRNLPNVKKYALIQQMIDSRDARQRKREQLIKENSEREEKRREELGKEEKEFLEFLDEIQYGGITKHSDFYVRILSPTEKDDLMNQFIQYKNAHQKEKL